MRPTPRRPNGGSSSASPENMDSLEAPLTTLKGGGGGDTYELKQEIVSNSVVVQEKSGKVQRKTSNTSSTRYGAYKKIGIGQCPIFFRSLIFPQKSM